MRLSEIFNQLTYGELSQFAVAGKNTNGIQYESYPEVIAHVNLALTALHKRFQISRKEVVILPYTTIHVYYLHTDYLVGNIASSKPVKYLVDSEDAVFTGDVIKIEQVFDIAGKEVPLNEAGNTASLFVNSYNSLKILTPDPENPLSVVYQADHPRIPIDSIYPDDEEVQLPPALLQPLLLFIAARVTASNPSITESNVNDSINFMNKYEMACLEIEQRNLLGTTLIDANTRFTDCGWV
jgi:hypothetical protein